jgi:DNA helicase-2/ATP-dependent DNA helicase PcrA
MENGFQSAYQEEQHRLSLAMEEIDRRLERLRNTPVYTGHDFTEQVLESGREEKRQALAKSAQEPYFGRMDFDERGRGQRKPLYIGKIGVEREQACFILLQAVKKSRPTKLLRERLRAWCI